MLRFQKNIFEPDTGEFDVLEKFDKHEVRVCVWYNSFGRHYIH